MGEPARSVGTAARAEELARLRLVALVVADDTEAPIEGAEVTVRGLVLARSDARGRIDTEVVVRHDAPHQAVREFEYALEGSGGARFDVWAPGWTHRTVEIQARPRGLVHLGVVRLRPAGEARGVVVDASGTPVPFAQVSWRPGDTAPAPCDSAALLDVPASEWNQLPETEADASGRFRLTGIPRTTGFLAAWSPFLCVGYGAPFQPGPRARSEITLVLAGWSGFVARIEGVVLDPSGAPAPWASVLATGPRYLGLEADATGHFVGPCDEPGTFAFVALDPTERFGPSASVSVDATAADDLVLQLTEARRCVVEVRDPEGAPVAGAHLSGRWENARDLPGLRGSIEPRETDATGRATVPRTLGALHLRVEAAGFRRAERVVPEGDDPPSALVVTLEPTASLRARLLHEGRPVAGARITPWEGTARAIRSDRVFTDENAFDCAHRIERHPGIVRTDAEGRFAVTAVGESPRILLVEAEGLPRTMFGPFQPPHPDERVLEIASGGALEGRVLLPPGARAFGRVVGVCNGFTLARTTLVNEDGTYRLEDLAPGDYQVRSVPGPAAEWIWFAPHGPERTEPIVFDCRVLPGDTTHFDVDLRDEGLCRWRVHVLFPMDAVRQGSARLLRLDPGGDAAGVGESPLDREGHVDFAVTTPGPHRLVVHLGEASVGGATTVELDTTLLPGEQETALDLAAGTLRFPAGVRPDGVASDRGVWVRFDVRADAGWRSETLVPLQGSPVEPLLVPVPSGILHVLTTTRYPGAENPGWRAAGELDLSPGQVLEPFPVR